MREAYDGGAAESAANALEAWESKGIVAYVERRARCSPTYSWRHDRVRQYSLAEIAAV